MTRGRGRSPLDSPTIVPRIGDGKIEREGAPLRRRALDVNLATEQARDLSADRQAETRASVLPARRTVGLLERLEDELLLVARDADARILHRERDHLIGAIQRPRREA